MSVPEIIQLVTTVLTVLLGGGALGVIIKARVERQNGADVAQNEARRDTNTAWDSIVENLQAQITNQTANFTNQVEYLTNELKTVKAELAEVQQKLNQKDRIILKAIAHIDKLEALLPPPVPERPEELK